MPKGRGREPVGIAAFADWPWISLPDGATIGRYATAPDSSCPSADLAGEPFVQLPANAPTNGWYNVLPAPAPARRVSGTVRVPWAVIGAGVTGLSAARQLALHRPDDPVALIEAERVGFGTSGRNSGFVLDLLFRGDEVPFPSVELARAHRRLCSGGLGILERLVRENQIECQWRTWGKLHVSAGPAGDRGLEGQRRGNDLLEVPYRDLDADEVAAVTGSRFYTCGVKTEGTALVNPAAMCRGLARTLPARADS